jgi:hypothetical protein
MAIPMVTARWKEREIPDFFVCVSNKLANTGGNGELEYYLGHESPALTVFFGSPGFRNEGFVHRRCLLDVLDALRDVYVHAFGAYRGGQSLVDFGPPDATSCSPNPTTCFDSASSMLRIDRASASTSQVATLLGSTSAPYHCRARFECRSRRYWWAQLSNTASN